MFKGLTQSYSEQLLRSAVFSETHRACQDMLCVLGRDKKEGGKGERVFKNCINVTSMNDTVWLCVSHLSVTQNVTSNDSV